MDIRSAHSPDDYAAARRLFVEYAGSLGFSLCFQGFDREIEMLSEMYGPPRGSLLLAVEHGEPIGCVALRPAGGATCEMKRLFVRPDHRGSGIGRRLAEAVLVESRRLGYERMILDTLPSMQRAQELYRELGFRETARADHPDGDGSIVYMSLDLDGSTLTAGHAA